MIFEYAAKINGVATPKYPAPGRAPVMLDTSEGNLVWRGVAWADYYEVQRSANGGGWTTIAGRVVDNVLAGNTIYSDNAGGNGNYLYRVRAYGKSGGVSGWSNVIGGGDGGQPQEPEPTTTKPPSQPTPTQQPQPGGNGKLPAQFDSAVASAYSPDGETYYFTESQDNWGPSMSTDQDTWSFTLVGTKYTMRNGWSQQCVFHKSTTSSSLDMTPQSADCSTFPLWTLTFQSATSTRAAIQAADGSNRCLQWDGNTISVAPCKKVDSQVWDLVSARG
ncbi:hypothetical protein HK104_011222 [Borealophlyctis nickersoniae]|nr:hypothetical protein HK104_011222 [Borealophlyctis nickersoniae]